MQVISKICVDSCLILSFEQPDITNVSSPLQPTHATPSLSTATNRRLYSAKELTTEAGLNAYDFAARWQSPALPIFTT
ncbi:MAG: hypothetical protein HDR89_09195, partial [Bacteroides sp.]|nr:hypothetical protein [Bacteroides sp.]